MILVLSNEADPHARAVRESLAALGAASLLLDLSLFPRQSEVAIAYGPGKDRRCLLQTPAGPIDFRQCGAIWWRRPQPLQLDAGITDASYSNFAYSESTEAISGLWSSLDAFWINEPARDLVAARKVHQLRVAQEIGLPIPDTLITNSAAEAGRFVEARGLGNVIFKAFSATESEWRETRLLREDELDRLENVRFAPVIFQTYIPAQYDLRITVVGDHIFAAAIYSKQTAYEVDCRMDIGNARIEAVELPPSVQEGLRLLMRRLGLVYGAIDMRLTPEGEYVFLEINPAGQWLFIEALTGQPITQAMAELLAAKDVPSA